MLRKMIGLSDTEIKGFVKSLENAMPITMTIADRNVKFKQLLYLLTELLVRHMKMYGGNGNNIPSIDNYFRMESIGMEQFIEPLNKQNIYKINEFQNKYSSPKICKDELFPYLEKYLKRNLKLGEKSKLKRLSTLKLE